MALWPVCGAMHKWKAEHCKRKGDEKMNDQQDAEIGHQAAAENTTLQIAASIKFEQQLEQTENI